MNAIDVKKNVDDCELLGSASTLKTRGRQLTQKHKTCNAEDHEDIGDVVDPRI